MPPRTIIPGSAQAAVLAQGGAGAAAGGKASLVVLPDQGIRGNSHMLMQDRNNLQIAGMLVDWMQANVRR